MRTLLLADNQDISRAGICYLSDRIAGFGQVLEIGCRSELIRALTASPDAVVVLDYTLFDLSGPEDLMILQARFPRASWMLFSEELSEDFIRRMGFGSEAFSVVMKDASLEEIEQALRAALRSERFICQRTANLLQYKKTPPFSAERPVLTATEQEILREIAAGKTTKEIAVERFSSIHTIATHRKNIFRKLGINNVHEATKYALRAGIIDAAEYYI